MIPPRGPRNLKACGFTNSLWRLEERERAARASAARRSLKRKTQFMIDLKLTKEEFKLVRLAVASHMKKRVLHDGKALVTLIDKFITELEKEEEERSS